jgi:hypothetical protein
MGVSGDKWAAFHKTGIKPTARQTMNGWHELNLSKFAQSRSFWYTCRKVRLILFLPAPNYGLSEMGSIVDGGVS